MQSLIIYFMMLMFSKLILFKIHEIRTQIFLNFPFNLLNESFEITFLFFFFFQSLMMFNSLIFLNYCTNYYCKYIYIFLINIKFSRFYSVNYYFCMNMKF